MTRIGILGGTFNPIHNAHVQMAKIARDEAHLDRVLIMVAADPPHKSVAGSVPAEERLGLARLAVEEEARVEVSDLEIRRGGKSYTLLTLQQLKAEIPDAELFLILGSDMLGDLPNWYHPEEVLRLSSVLCVPRTGIEENDAETAAALARRYGAVITLLQGRADRIASTEIRDRMAAGLPTEGLMPEAVAQACYESGAYFRPEIRSLQRKLRAALTKKRYRHVCATMRAAAELAANWGQDAKRAQLAALLHDCAKCLPARTQEVFSGDESGIWRVHHAFAGAVVARTEYGVTDETILRAIRLHTTGDEGMTAFDAVIYAADIVEPTRAFSCVEEYREAAKQGPEPFMSFALERTICVIGEQGWPVHPATQRAAEYYKTLKNRSRETAAD